MRVRLLLLNPKTVIIHAVQSTFRATMFSAVSTASYPMDAWQKHMLSFRARLFALCMASGRLRTDVMQEENVMVSLRPKRAMYLTKTPF